MELLDLRRNDLLQTAATRRGTLVVLPSGANKQQKVAVGDLSGVVQCFSVKNNACKATFKSLPSPKRFAAVALGRGHSQRDRVFLAEGSVIQGLTKKGREFFRFETNLTESAEGLLVEGTTLCVLGEYSCVTFEDNREKCFYLSPDRINDFDWLPLNGKRCLALACQDRSVRVLDGETVLHRAAVQGVATCVVHVAESHDPFCKFPEASELLYGTESGVLGQILLDSINLQQGFVVENSQKRGPVTAIFSGIDFTKDGMTDIAIGRDDGFVEIYSMDESGSLSKVFESKVSDRINTLAGGFVTSTAAQDLIVQTYTGKVIAYGSQDSGLFGKQPLSKSNRNSIASRSQNNEKAELLDSKIDELKSEVAELAKQFKEKKELVSLLPDASFNTNIDLKQSCRFDSSQNCFVLMIEVEVPIFCIALCCDVHIELMPSANSVAILSISPSNEENGFLVLATFRCQECANRLDIRFRTKEGEPGTMTCFVLPKTNSKIAMAVHHRILPLCLHEPVESLEEDCYSLLQINGDYTREELCLWFGAALPDFPRQWITNRALFFRNSVSGNGISIEANEGQIKIRSQDICSLNILRETVVQEANKRSRAVQSKLIPDMQSLRTTLGRLWKEIELHRGLDEKLAIGTALLEIQQQEGTVDFLDADLKQVLEDTATLAEAQAEKTQRTEHVTESMFALLRHYSLLTGKDKAPFTLQELQETLENHDFTLQSVLDML